MSLHPRLRPVDKMEMRLMREAGATVKQCAGYFNCSVPTAMRALADLRRRMGPEKFKAENVGQRARAYLYTSHIAATESAHTPSK